MSIRMYIRRDFMRGLQSINIISYGNGSERLQQKFPWKKAIAPPLAEQCDGVPIWPSLAKSATKP